MVASCRLLESRYMGEVTYTGWSIRPCGSSLPALSDPIAACCNAVCLPIRSDTGDRGRAYFEAKTSVTVRWNLSSRWKRLNELSVRGSGMRSPAIKLCLLAKRELQLVQ